MQRRLLAGCTLVAVVATAGSLYFSEVVGYIPCELCWYQRILMYPLVVVLGVAALENRGGVWKSALPLSGLGVVVAAYHSLLQVTADAGMICGVGAGCGSVDWRGFGVFTIPRLSLLAFVLISAGLIAVAWRERADTR
ncbi:disulfide bond formation protein B [Halopiger goleimassiliensis]|uniref:disulfide bond formation protein B n=1 Tax=Halopiger goleimassiliensis TaxID=1293048 RepID=UPI000677A730|nr:disulfide bond formation protein B [Halopiger goleimassiliensis]